MVEDSIDRHRALPGAQHAPGIPEGLPRGSLLGGAPISPKGKVPRRVGRRGTAMTHEPMFVGNTKDRYPKPDGKYTFDKLSSVFITGNATRDERPTTSACRSTCRARSPKPGAGCVPPGSTRSPRTPRGTARGRDRQLHQLRAVRSDHRQGRPAHHARGRRRASLPDHLIEKQNSPARARIPPAGFRDGLIAPEGDHRIPRGETLADPRVRGM